jgi:basic membrane protein A
MVIVSACSETNSSQEEEPKRVKVGIMLSDVGLGDQSFSDAGFAGLEKARNELNISFDYREIDETGTYENGLEQLVKQQNDIIIGLGFAMQEAIETVAKKHPKQKFLLIDGVSDVPNVHSLTFKEEEGSFLIGVLAGMKTKSNVVGFVGGMDVPLIRKFEQGFIKGVNEVNPDAEVLSAFAGDFGNDKLGEEMAAKMLGQNADFIYPAAGFTGVGVLHEVQKQGKYGFGVDSDQYFLAEKSIVSSMLKRIDVAVFNVAKQLVETGNIQAEHIELGLKEEGVALAPIRVLPLSEDEETKLTALQEKMMSGSIEILGQ